MTDYERGYRQGYADAMNWKTQNHLEHLPGRQELVIDCPRCGHCCPQPEQEPVAWANKDDLQNFDMRVRTGGGVYHTVPLYTTPPAAQPFWDLFDENQRLRAELKFNTTPPQQWVGLTREDMAELRQAGLHSISDYAFEVIANFLKEKNGSSQT